MLTKLPCLRNVVILIVHFPRQDNSQILLSSRKGDSHCSEFSVFNYPPSKENFAILMIVVTTMNISKVLLRSTVL
jgi:hypothetical protein